MKVEAIALRCALSSVLRYAPDADAVVFEFLDGGKTLEVSALDDYALAVRTAPTDAGDQDYECSRFAIAAEDAREVRDFLMDDVDAEGYVDVSDGVFVLPAFGLAPGYTMLDETTPAPYFREIAPEHAISFLLSELILERLGIGNSERKMWAFQRAGDHLVAIDGADKVYFREGVLSK